MLAISLLSIGVLISYSLAKPTPRITTHNVTCNFNSSYPVRISISIYPNPAPDPQWNPTTHYLLNTITPFQPTGGPGVPITASRLTCTFFLNVTLDEPGWRIWTNGWGMNMRGYLPLATGTSAVVKNVYEWVGESTQCGNLWEKTGPFEGHIDIYRVDNATDNFILSPCNGGLLKIVYQTRLRTAATQGSGIPLKEDEEWGFSTSLELEKCRA